MHNTSLQSRIFWRWIIVLLVVAVGLAIAIALAREGRIGWLFEMKPIAEGPLDEIAVALAPILGLALAIERIVETVFELFEQSTEKVAELGSAGLDGLHWLRDELDRAWVAAGELAQQYDSAESEDSDTSDLLAKLEVAERRILEAQKRIAGLVKDPRYVSAKRTTAISMTLLLGLIVAIVSDTGLCELLHIRAPRIVDMILTGFIIGAGSGPMHSLVGILQSTKDALENLGDSSRLDPLERQIEELKDKVS
jgi:hypothetical protein